VASGDSADIIRPAAERLGFISRDSAGTPCRRQNIFEAMTQWVDLAPDPIHGTSALLANAS
jgi:hypothetical protein